MTNLTTQLVTHLQAGSLHLTFGQAACMSCAMYVMAYCTCANVKLVLLTAFMLCCLVCTLTQDMKNSSKCCLVFR